jgi:hypothetical protein
MKKILLLSSLASLLAGCASSNFVSCADSTTGHNTSANLVWQSGPNKPWQVAYWMVEPGSQVTVVQNK